MKRYRSMKIKEIIQHQIIETQEELAAALKREGIIVTQATVSRDIKDLMLIKIPYKDGHYRYALSTEKPGIMTKNHTSFLFQEAVIGIESSMNLIVIHTLPGSAQLQQPLSIRPDIVRLWEHLQEMIRFSLS